MPGEPNLILFTDMDRTLMPNGQQPESAQARPMLRQLAKREDVILVYVTGRDLGRVEAAIEEYQLPLPDFVIGDVGSSIYAKSADGWAPETAWQSRLAGQWHGLDAAKLEKQLGALPGAEKQAEDRLGPFKLSFDVHPGNRLPETLRHLKQRLTELELPVTLIHSIDETTDTGLIDLLPAAASKRKAVEWIVNHYHWPRSRVLFAGDSGNDLDLLVSSFRSVLVANATEALRQQILTLADYQGAPDSLYFAQGFQPREGLALNGFYASGILEGVAHFFPELFHELVEGHCHV